jgi:hypothetical protein
MLVFFLRGRLPWQGIGAPSKSTKERTHRTVLSVKKSTSLKALCEGFPEEFAQFIQYARSLDYEEEPDYDYLRQLLRNVSAREKYAHDDKFDWN